MHLTEFLLSGATLVGSPMGNMIYEDNSSITCHFVMPARYLLSKSTETSGLRGCAWHVRMYPAASSSGSSA